MSSNVSRAVHILKLLVNPSSMEHAAGTIPNLSRYLAGNSVAVVGADNGPAAMQQISITGCMAVVKASGVDSHDIILEHFDEMCQNTKCPSLGWDQLYTAWTKS
jgi:hypothetical protein